MTPNELKLIKEFERFHQSRFPHTTSATIERAMGYMSPTIMEEREMNVSQMDVFSRLMMDRIIYFGTEVTEQACNIAVSQLLYLSSVNEDDITMYINSPGGEVYSGMGVVDTMMFIKPVVKTTCTGLAASMGSVILACGNRGERSILPHARVMIHQPSTGVKGMASDILITAEEIKKLREELFEVLAIRSGQPIEKLIQDGERDHWFTAKEAKEYGLVDNVLKINLDK